MVLMVILTLHDLRKAKRKSKKKKTSGGEPKKDRWFRRQRKAPNKWLNKDFIQGGGLFGLLPTSILGDIGDSLPRASDRYTYTISVSNMYHSLGREGVHSLREEARRERAQEREQAM